MRVRDLMTPEPITIDKDERLETVLKRMYKHGISKLPVTENGSLVGVIADGDIVDELGAVKNRGISPTTLHVTTGMRREFQSVRPDDEVLHVVEMCKREGVGIIPVTENGKLHGVITKADLLPLVRSTKPVSEVMARSLRAVSPDDRVIHARRIMIDHGIERLPVLESGALVGIVSELDLALALDRLKKEHEGPRESTWLRTLFVRDVMRRRVITTPPSTSVQDAAAIMRKEDVGCLPVVDGERIVGLVTRTDLIRTIETV